MTSTALQTSQAIQDGHGAKCFLSCGRCVHSLCSCDRFHSGVRLHQVENFTAPVDHHNTTVQFNASVHGYSGPLLPTLPNAPTSIDPLVIATTEVDPVNFPFNLDMNSGNTIGLGTLLLHEIR